MRIMSVDKGICFCSSCKGNFEHTRKTIRDHHEKDFNLTHDFDLSGNSDSDHLDSADENYNNDNENSENDDNDSDDVGLQIEGACGIVDGHDSGGDSDGEGDEDNLQLSDESIDKHILRLLKAKVKFGWSQAEALNQLQSLFELLGDERIPHEDWRAVIRFLKRLGYQNPRMYKVCCGENHVRLLEEQQNCPECNNEWAGCVSYYILGIKFEDIFVNGEFLKRHLAHWEDRESWFLQERVKVPKKETWHGQRFADLSYFWDSNSSTLLPAVCPGCNTVISKNFLNENNLVGEVEFEIECNQCFQTFRYQKKYMKGSPLNQAFIFHEDGFNAFKKKTRSIATIQYTSACARKDDRCHSESLHVYSFVPSCYIKEGIPHKMDAFLQPLIDDVKKLYIEGLDITLENQVELRNCTIPAGVHHVRLLLLAGTADIKAHAEMILYASGMSQ